MLHFLTDICSLPTAPFLESAVVDYARAFVRERPNLRLKLDTWGNLLIELPGRGGRSSRRWVFTAHMDHPALVAKRMTGPRTLAAEMRGGVLAHMMKGTAVRFFAAEREIVGTVRSAKPEKDSPRAASAVVAVPEPVPPGAFGVFDQGTGRTQRGRFLSRAIDDLGGVAAALAMLDQLCRKPPAATVAVLLTRAEEVGFIGAIAAAKSPQLLRKSDLVIAIECSAEQPYAPLGKGAIIRVGDKTSVFDSGLTYFLGRAATDLAAKDRSFRFQRALMPGGTCEATVYDVYGFTASSICVPLGNYHNMDPKRSRLGPEYIDVSDWRNMVKLFIHLARTGHAYEPGLPRVREKIEKNFVKVSDLLR